MHGGHDPAIYRADMSSLLHPVGHLPASVYWVRRAVVLAVLLLLIVLLFRVFGGGEDPQPAASSGPVESPSSTTPTLSPSASPSPGGSSTTSSPSRAPRKDDGRCTGAMVRVQVAPGARRVSSGRPLNFQVQLTTPRRDGCAAVVDATRLVLTITSGKDRIWTTAHCGKSVQRATFALSSGRASNTTVAWHGRRSAAGCPSTAPVAKPGTYVIQATYDGRPSTQQAFLVV
jgi:hypothetical protein